MRHVFKPEIKTVATVHRRFATSDIANEQMVFSSDWEFALENGGEITRWIMEHLRLAPEWSEAVKNGELKNRNIVIDTRTNMLMEGMYPSIPGWHCDDNVRLTETNQPDPRLNEPSVQHFMVLLSDNKSPVARTEFVTENVDVELDPHDVWYSLDNHIDQSDYRKGFLDEGMIIRFSQNAIHRATCCETPGWRYFFRASVTHRKPANQIRRQVQVYTTRNGW